MAGNNFFFNGQGEPLFSPTQFNSANSESQYQELQRMQDEIEQRKQMMMQASQQPKPQASKTPMWDEVEKVMNDLTDAEYESIINADEYKQSLERVMGILQREEMKIVLPYVEGCKDGKEAIEEHLANLKHIKKSLNKQKEENMALFNEYTQHYSDMTYADFIAMKRDKKGGKK